MPSASPRPHRLTSEQGLRSPCSWVEKYSDAETLLSHLHPLGEKSCPYNWAKAIGQNSGSLLGYGPQGGQCVKSLVSVLEVTTVRGAEASKEEGAGALGNRLSLEPLVRTPHASGGSRAAPGQHQLNHSLTWVKTSFNGFKHLRDLSLLYGDLFTVYHE